MNAIALPQPVQDILRSLTEAGFEAYIVGGCVRDLLLGRTPKDWDITTNALPEQIQAIFPDSFYENDFGTVGIKVEPFSHYPRPFAKGRPARIATLTVAGGAGEGLSEKNSSEVKGMQNPDLAEISPEKEIIEVTTYRTESGYTDARHPDEVHFTTSLTEDLARRDFTINAMAIGMRGVRSTKYEVRENPKNADANPLTSDSLLIASAELELVDPFHGQEDLQKKVIRAVGAPEERFAEDALRLMRAVRFWSELAESHPLKEAEPIFDTITNAAPKPIIHPQGETNWHIEPETFQALKDQASNIAKVSWERIRDEFSKIILSPNPAEGVHLLTATHLLDHILPELYEGLGVGQNLHHVYSVYEHNLRALKTCPSTKLSVRLASLLHDVGKPRTKRGNGHYSTFYNHDHVGARMARPILTRLRFPSAVIDHATMLVDNHLFYYNVDEVTEASVRRLIARVGLENIPDLIHVRIGDRLGSGTPKAKPYRLRHFEYMVDKVSQDAVSVKMLKINGKDLMEKLGLAPGPKIGAILDVLLAEVIDNATLNDAEKLLNRARELDHEDLNQLRTRAKQAIDNQREKDDTVIKQKHWV
jgi:poly(A) polymerase/tRNA nucleotidyltransferase (CCA-adding enzyme)